MTAWWRSRERCCLLRTTIQDKCEAIRHDCSCQHKCSSQTLTLQSLTAMPVESTPSSLLTMASTKSLQTPKCSSSLRLHSRAQQRPSQPTAPLPSPSFLQVDFFVTALASGPHLAAPAAHTSEVVCCHSHGAGQLLRWPLMYCQIGGNWDTSLTRHLRLDPDTNTVTGTALPHAAPLAALSSSRAALS